MLVLEPRRSARARAIVEPFLAKNRSKAQTMLICKRAVHTDCLGLQTTDPHHQSFFFCTRRLVYITVSFKLPNETRRMGFIVRDKKDAEQMLLHFFTRYV